MVNIVSSKKQAKKHQGLSHSSTKLTFLAEKVANVLLWNAFDPNDNGIVAGKKYDMDWNIVAILSGFDSKDTKYLKDAVKSLYTVVGEWEDSEEWESSTFIASAKIRKGDSTFTYDFSNVMADKLSDPKRWSKLDVPTLLTIGGFRSGRTGRIYDICCQFKGILRSKKTAYTQWYTLEEFRKYLKIESDKSYQEFKILNREILKPAIKTINGDGKKNKGTDIIIQPEYKKQGRRISDIRFSMVASSQMQLGLDEGEIEKLRKTELYKDAIDAGLP